MIRILLYSIFIFISNNVLGQKNITFSIGEDFFSPKIGYNSPLIHSPNWEDNEFNLAITKLSPSLIRYPGGSISFYWDWENGKPKSYSDFSKKIIKYDSKYTEEYLKVNSHNQKSSFFKQLKRYNASDITIKKLSHFSKVLHRSKSEGIFVLNIISSSLKEEIEMLKNAKKENIKIKYVEIGNEINHKHELLQKVYTDAKTYADTCENWIKSIKEFFPKTKIGIVGGSKGEFKDWNEVLAKRFKNDKNVFFILHHYPILYQDFDINNYNDFKKFISLSEINLDKKLKEWKWEETIGYSTWVTEFNIIQKNKNKIHNTWAHALFNSNQIHQFIKKTKAEIIIFHSIGSNKFSQFSAIDLTKNYEGKYLMTAPGLSTHLWSKFLSNSNKITEIKFDNNFWTFNSLIKFNPIHAYKTIKNNKTVLFICNSTNDSYSINTSMLGIKSATIEQYFGDLKNNISDEINQINSWKKNIEIFKDSFILPPYSINLITEN